MYDVIVVGARCAGAPLAMLLARRGHRVLVVDRATFPSDTVSTHYVHQAGLSLLNKWGLLDRVIATGVPAIQHLNFSYTGIDISGFAFPIDGLEAVYCPRRHVLDKILVDAAREAGAEVVENFTVTGLIEEDGRVAGVRGEVNGGPAGEFKARFVVGADGTNSVVASLVGADVYRREPASCFVYYSYFTGVDWGMHHRTGFGEQQIGTWPTNDGQLLAVMRKRDRFSEFRADPAASFQAVYDEVHPELGARLRDSGQREEPFRAMRYPDNYYRRSSGPGWALAGDAGYHKDPFTGWGITDSFKQADLLAERLHEGLAGTRPIDEATAEYVTTRDEQSHGTFELTVSISELTLTPFYESVFRAVGQSPEFSRRFLTLIAGGLTGEAFFAPEHLEELYDAVGTPAGQRILASA